MTVFRRTTLFIYIYADLRFLNRLLIVMLNFVPISIKIIYFDRHQDIKISYRQNHFLTDRLYQKHIDIPAKRSQLAKIYSDVRQAKSFSSLFSEFWQHIPILHLSLQLFVFFLPGFFLVRLKFYKTMYLYVYVAIVTHAVAN